MSTNSNDKNYIFRKVAALCGLRISLYITLVLLTISFLGLIFSGYRTTSPLYILIFGAILPEWIQMVVFPDSDKKKEPKLPFPLFCKKYHYSLKRHKAMNLACLIVFIMLGAWHISYWNNTSLPAFVTALPSLIAIINLVTRLLITIAYHIYFTYFPLKAMR